MRVACCLKLRHQKTRYKKQITQLQDIEKQISLRLKEEKAAKQAELAADKSTEKSSRCKEDSPKKSCHHSEKIRSKRGKSC